MDNRKGQIIRIHRLKLGLTQEEIALTLGMATHHYQRYEYGESLLANSRMSTGLRICSLLQLDPYDMVFDLSAAEMADIDWSCGYENTGLLRSCPSITGPGTIPPMISKESAAAYFTCLPMG